MSYPMPPESYRTLQPERAGRRIRIWDVALTVVLLVLLTLFTLGASYASLFLGFASDACGAQNCDFGIMDIGFRVAMIAPWVILALAVGAAIFMLVVHRIAFWIPLVAAALMVGMWFVGAAIVGLGVGR